MNKKRQREAAEKLYESKQRFIMALTG